MSKGTPVRSIRIGSDLWAVMNEVIGQVNERRKEQPYDVSAFVRAAVRDKIAHIMRSRKKGKGKPAPITDPLDQADEPIVLIEPGNLDEELLACGIPPNNYPDGLPQGRV